MKVCLYLRVLLVLSLLSACGGGGGGNGNNQDPPPDPPITSCSGDGQQGTANDGGVFLDSLVQGLGYVTQQATVSGVTDASGNFGFLNNETIGFSIGNIIIGGPLAGDEFITPAHMLSPVNLAANFNAAADASDLAATNLARLLLVLDADSDSSNGIFLPCETRNAAGRIDLTLDAGGFDAQQAVADLLVLVGKTTGDMPTAGVAQAHLEQSIYNYFSGVYQGSLQGAVSGTPVDIPVFLSIDSNGQLTLPSMDLFGDGSAITDMFNTNIATDISRSFTGNINAHLGSFPFTITLDSGQIDADRNLSVNWTVGALGSGTLTAVLQPGGSSYTVSGSVTGLTGSGLVLQNNGKDDLAISADGTFSFSTPLLNGSLYSVSVASQPSLPGQLCSVMNANGTVYGADITNIIVSCTNAYTVGGSVTGLTGSGLVLQVNGGNDLPVTADGNFVFNTLLIDGSGYSVSVMTQPGLPSQVCTVTNGNNVINGVNVSDIVVSCVDGVASYSLGGSITGIPPGTEVILGLDTGSGRVPLPVNMDGSFVFDTPLPDGSSYTVTVDNQPAAPGVVCVVNNGTGVVNGAPINNIQIDCVSGYSVGGSVTGLTGSGLILQNNNGDDITIFKNGNFTFPTFVADGRSYNVTVFNQPSNPSQTCTVSNASGTSSGAAVTTVQVDCVVNTYSIGGTVSGLSGTGLQLGLNGGTDVVNVSSNGSFSFPTAIPDGLMYGVEVLIQPSSPTQLCTVMNGSGSLNGADVTDIQVDCTAAYTVGGTVTGLTGSGLILSTNTEFISISADGSFTFNTPLLNGTVYYVQVASYPTGPSQLCSIINGSGTISAASVSNVQVNCQDAFTVGGTVSGMLGIEMQLQLNGGEVLTVSGDGNFVFNTPLSDGIGYEVVVGLQPYDPAQVCSVINGTGSIATANVSNISIDCVSHYTIRANVSGLNGSGLQLQNNAGDDITVNADGIHAFATTLAEGSSYAVTVIAQPVSPVQTCLVSNATGVASGYELIDVYITCTDSRFVSGNVSGLNGSGLVLQNNGNDDLVIATNGTFKFPVMVSDGTGYAVTVAAQPTAPDQFCTVSMGSGIASQDITNVDVVCVNTYSVGGTVSGLTGSGLQLQVNGTDDLIVNTNGGFIFSSLLIDGSAYEVTIASQPAGPAQYCVVQNGTGIISGSNIADIVINCVNAYTVSGTVSGLGGTGLVLRNGTEQLPVSANGNFSFSVPVGDGYNYSVLVHARPVSPDQRCTVTNGNGTITGVDVTDVQVVCENGYYVRGTVNNLIGDAVTLRLTAPSFTDTSTVYNYASSSFTFQQLLVSGESYLVTVSRNPANPAQNCVVTNATGTIIDHDMGNVTVDCQ